jgi:pimeloyl-ACP methyl ester carboxylesterase
MMVTHLHPGRWSHLSGIVHRWPTSLLALVVLLGCAEAQLPSSIETVEDRPPVSASSPAPELQVGAGSVWGTDIWFADPDASRVDFVAGELEPLLGSLNVNLGVAGPIEHADGQAWYRNPLGERVPLEIRLPGGGRWDGSTALPADAPLMVALHQTNTVGGSEPCGGQPYHEQAFGTFFATHGYLVVCPTLSFTGERQAQDSWDTASFYDRYPTWSAMGKDVSEVSWLIDSLTAQGLGRVGDGITVVGHSQGAIYALYAAAIDARITRVVANGGYVDTQLDPHPERWSRTSWYRAFRDEPRGLDQLEVVAAIAPRCALLIDYDHDDILEATVPSPARLSAFEARFPTITWDRASGPHAWPDQQLGDALRWLSDEGTGCEAP